MPYNAIAGRSVERLTTLSDGVFAIAMTLLVLDVKVPSADVIHSNGQLLAMLADRAPNMLAYVMSFLTLGIFWMAQGTQLSQCEQSDKVMTWIHILYLMFVAIMPFSTGLLAEFMEYRAAVICYWANLLLLGAALFASIRHAKAAQLLKADALLAESNMHERRILAFQALYLLAALGVIVSSYLSVALLAGLQLFSILTPAKLHKTAGIDENGM